MTKARTRPARQVVRLPAHDLVRGHKALLCASVALATTASIAAARKVIAGWDGPADVRDNAIRLLDELTTATTEEVTAADHAV